MFEESTLYTFEPSTKSPEVTLEVPCKESSETAQPSHDLRPKSARELADEYEVSDKTVQTWFKAVCAAYPWIAPETLKTGRSAKTRYTPLCQALIAEYRTIADSLSEEDWIASVHVANPDKVAASPFDAKPPEPKPEAESAIVSVQIEVMDIDGLHQQQQAQARSLTLRQQATEALSEANQARLVELREFFTNQQTQRQTDQTQRQAQLEAEAQNEAIEEFLIKQQAKNAVLSQLEQLNSLGKLTAATVPPAG